MVSFLPALPTFLEFLYCKRQTAPNRLLDTMKAKQSPAHLKAGLQFESPIPLKSNKKIPSDIGVDLHRVKCPLETTTGG